MGNNCENAHRRTTQWAVMVLVRRALSEVTRNSKNGDWNERDSNIAVSLEAAVMKMYASGSAVTNRQMWDVTKQVSWCGDTFEKRSSNPYKDSGCVERSPSWVSSVHSCKF